MKEDNKKKAMGAFIVITFGLSSFAFIFTGFGGGGAIQNEGTEPLTSFVVNEKLSRDTEVLYINNGYTIMQYFYTENSDDIFIDSLPDTMTTLDGQRQLIIEKISSTDTRVVIESAVDRVVINEVDQLSIFNGLCQTLVVRPSTCLLQNLTEESS
jgi:hypothetical protein